MIEQTQRELSGEILEERYEYTLAEICRDCSVHEEFIIDLVHEGVLDPKGTATVHWRFSAVSVLRVHKTLRLQRDLGVNLAGAALALELLDEINALRERLQAEKTV